MEGSPRCAEEWHSCMDLGGQVGMQVLQMEKGNVVHFS